MPADSARWWRPRSFRRNISFCNTGPVSTGLNGPNSLQILGKIIECAGQVGLKVILDDHWSEAGNPRS